VVNFAAVDRVLCAAIGRCAPLFLRAASRGATLVRRCRTMRPDRWLARCPVARRGEPATRCLEDAAAVDSLPLDDESGTSEEATVGWGRLIGWLVKPCVNAITAAKHASPIPAPSPTRGGTLTRSRTARHPSVSALRTRRRFVRRSRGSPGSSVSQTEFSAGSGSRTVGTATRRASRRRSGVTLATSSLSLGGFNVPIPPLADIPRACYRIVLRFWLYSKRPRWTKAPRWKTPSF